jgi:hypothetical protein
MLIIYSEKSKKKVGWQRQKIKSRRRETASAGEILKGSIGWVYVKKALTLQPGLSFID